MVVINIESPSDKEIEWLSVHVGERLSYLPHYIGGTGWRYRRILKGNSQWTLEFDDDKIASYYILKFK